MQARALLYVCALSNGALEALADSKRALTDAAPAQVRALLYVGALSNGILEALANLERALTDAIITPVRLRHPPPPKGALRSMVGLRLPLVLERLSALTTRLPRRNSPIMEGSQEGSSHRACSAAAEEDDGREARGWTSPACLFVARGSVHCVQQALLQRLI